MFGSTKDIFIKVHKKNLRSFPRLTTDLINKYLLPELATLKGHQKHEFKGIQSTKKPIDSTKKEEPDIQSTLEPLGKRLNIVLIKLDDLEKLTYSDQIDRFLVTSSCGYKYIMIAYNKDSNVILAESTKSRKVADLKNIFAKIHNNLQ